MVNYHRPVSDDISDHKLMRKLAAARDKQKSRIWPLRVLVILVGVTVLLAGLAMLVAPGPAFAVIPIGLFILALEFVWAEQALGQALKQAKKAEKAAKETSRNQRILLIIAALLATAGIVFWAVYGDIPVLPF